MTGWPTEADAALQEALAIFDRVAPRYDLMRTLVSGGRESSWKSETLGAAAPPRVRLALDLATGTGDVAALVLRRHATAGVIGLDAHPGMLARARAKHGDDVLWMRGDLNRLPFAREPRFDLVTIGYGLRYVPDLPALLSTCHDLVAPGGVLWTFDLGRPASRTWRGVWMTYLALTGTLLGTVLHARPQTYWHLVQSLAAYPGQQAVAEMMQRAGFAEVRVLERLGGVLAVHVARRAG